jgi:ribonucleoside-diphosphate reductase beta chain
MQAQPPCFAPAEQHRKSRRQMLRRLNTQSKGFQLFTIAKQAAWDPADIDFSADRADWQMLCTQFADERYAEQLLLLCALFHAGEQSVTTTLVPLVDAVGRAKLGIEKEMFLTSQLFEEAKHAEFFDRWLSEVPGNDVELPALPASAIRVLSTDLDNVAERLRAENDPRRLRALLVEFVVHYMGMVEGMLARSGYRAAHEALAAHGWMPGLQEGFAQIQRDEGRHIGFGLHLLGELLSDEPEDRAIVQRTFREHLPDVRAAVAAFDYPIPLVAVNPLERYAMDSYAHFAAVRAMPVTR